LNGFYRSDLKIIKYLRPAIYSFMIKFGLLPDRYSEIMNIYNTYSEYMELENCSKSEAVQFCARYYHSSEQTILNIVTELE